MQLYNTKDEALAAAAAESEKRRRLSEEKQNQDAQQLASEVYKLRGTLESLKDVATRYVANDRERMRNAMAASVAQGLIIAWKEDRPDVMRLTTTTMKIVDTLMDAMEKTKDGDYGAIPAWNASGW